MRMVPGFILREIAGETVAVPTGDAAVQLSGLMSLNGSGKLLFELLQEDRSEEELVSAFLQVYDIDEKTARADIRTYLERLYEGGLIVP